jgi:VanZ family protein
VGWVVVVIAFSAIPLSKDLKDLYENRFVRGDYLIHFLVFLLGCLIYRLNARQVGNHEASSWSRALLIFILVVALISEAIQLLVPSRTFNVYDVLANYTGISVGIALTVFFRRSPSAK